MEQTTGQDHLKDCALGALVAWMQNGPTEIANAHTPVVVKLCVTQGLTVKQWHLNTYSWKLLI